MRNLFLILILITTYSYSQDYPLKIALLKYGGGGDWYADPTALPNLIDFCNKI